MLTHFDTPSGTRDIELVATRPDQILPVSLVYNQDLEEIVATAPDGTQRPVCWTITDLDIDLDAQSVEAQRWLACLEELEWVPTHLFELLKPDGTTQRWVVEWVKGDEDASTLSEFAGMKPSSWFRDDDGEWRRQGDEDWQGTLTITELPKEDHDHPR